MTKTRSFLRAGAALALAALAAGCANTHSIQVGAIPDDYRTNHPIVIKEKQHKLDIAVGMMAYGMNSDQKGTLLGFLSNYEPQSGSAVVLLVPAGSANEAAASRVAADMMTLLNRKGIAKGHVYQQPYGAPPDVAAPIRIYYSAIRADVAGECGRWPADLLDTNQNRHWANFGCAYQNNLAAQIANPNDLLGPRKQTTIDAENRSNAIQQYKDRGIAPEFYETSEVFYD